MVCGGGPLGWVVLCLCVLTGGISSVQSTGRLLGSDPRVHAGLLGRLRSIQSASIHPGLSILFDLSICGWCVCVCLPSTAFILSMSFDLTFSLSLFIFRVVGCYSSCASVADVYRADWATCWVPSTASISTWNSSTLSAKPPASDENRQQLNLIV